MNSLIRAQYDALVYENVRYRDHIKNLEEKIKELEDGWTLNTAGKPPLNEDGESEYCIVYMGKYGKIDEENPHGDYQIAWWDNETWSSDSDPDIEADDYSVIKWKLI